MKGDFTRFTFDPKKHYSGVRMQQGRVLLDSDWNEQADINDHRCEIEARDIIGRSGCPADQAGFGIITKIDDLTKDEKERIKTLDEGDFVITVGRYYVDGILCENEQNVKFTEQSSPLLIDKLSLNAENQGKYLVYLDAWKRHITYIEDTEIREVALGGPDTTTRTKVVWQVKALPLPINEGMNCSDLYDFPPSPSGARLSTDIEVAQTSKSPCKLAPKGGYHGLENQLYRVEIHDGGEPYLLSSVEEIVLGRGISASWVSKNEVRIDKKANNPDGRPFSEGQYIEVFDMNSGGTIVLAQIMTITESGDKKNLILDQDVPQNYQNLSIQRVDVATFKWSRDNGSIVFPIEGFYPDVGKSKADKVGIGSIRHDKTLSLRPGDWVEFLYDDDELLGRPGFMVQITPASAGESERVVTLSSKVPIIDLNKHPKLRRWDQKILPVTYGLNEDNSWTLENGLTIKFSGTNFKTGDYWTFYARSASGRFEKLIEAAPQGIEHHYACIGLVSAIDTLEVTNDCRRIFPQLTDVSLIYAGGDGQEAMPNYALDQPIRVMAVIGNKPVAGANILFEIVNGGGSFDKPAPNIVPQKKLPLKTDPNGNAMANWFLGTEGIQQARADLIDEMGNTIGLPVYFGAGLSTADAVFYDPASCPKLQGATTVKNAINMLCPANMLYYVGGDGQDGLPNQVLPQKLQVMVADSRGPVLLSMPVNFTAARGGGKVQEAGDPVGHDSVTISTKDGIAECNWILGPSGDQQVEASIPGIKPIRFSANLNLAALVAYTPPKDCVKMSGIGDVQNAINQLCPANILYAVSGDGQVGTPGEIVTLQVGVADSRGPVLSKVPIQFKVLPEVTPAPILIPPGYNGNGIYEWKWTLGGLTTQQVEASLLSPDGKTPIGLPVRFNAFLRTADSIAYANSNPNLHLKVNTVQEALEQLSSDRSDFNITGVQFLAEYGQKLSSLDNGAVIRADLLVQSGLSISCSEDVDPLSFREDGGLLLRRVLRKPACTVFIEAPYFSPNEREISSQQLALAGIANVPTNNANVILWMPSSSKTSDILDTLSYYCAHASDVGNDNGLILAHLLIKGNFVRNKKLNKYLDGDRFATSTTGQLSRFLPSGDGRAGGDFEMWFWISDPIMVSLSDLSGVKLTSANSPVNITGSLKLDRNAPADLEFSITQTTNIPNLKFASFSATIMNGFPSVSFSFSLSVSMMPTDKTGGPFTISAVLQKWNGIQVDNSVIRNSRSINVAFQ